MVFGCRRKHTISSAVSYPRFGRVRAYNIVVVALRVPREMVPGGLAACALRLTAAVAADFRRNCCAVSN